MTIPSPFNLELEDGRSRGKWLFQLTGVPEVKWLTQDQFSIVLNQEGRRIGDFDEQRNWNGGRGGERFSDDPTKYRDGKDVCAWFEGHVFPNLQWNISEGYRVAEQALPGSVGWRGLFGSTRYIARKFTCSPAMTADKAYLWVRRVGTPGTLTFELRGDTTDNPGSVLQTVTKTTSDITDYISVLQVFDWTGTESLSNATAYWIVVYGASTDSTEKHWEVGVNVAGTDSKYSTAGSTWTQAAFSMYFRITDADTLTRRWWFFNQGTNFCAVSNDATAKLYKWNETSDLWEEIAAATHGLGQVTGRPVELNRFVYFPQGLTTLIRVWDGTNWDSQTVAYGIGFTVGYSATDNSSQLWLYSTNAVFRANAVDVYTTDLPFGPAVMIGDTTNSITNIISVNNVLWTFKANSVGTVENDRYTELDFGMKKAPSSDNGIAAISWNGMLYFNWLFTMNRIYSGTVDDVGQGFKTNSFPIGREGVHSAYTSYVAWLFAAHDSGASGTSSIQLYDGINWHEFSRAWEAGRRIRDVAVQIVSGGRNRLWWDCGGDLCYIEFPLNKANPLFDTSAKYMHEAVIESAVIDMGTASKLPKYIKEMTLTSKNMDGQEKKVYLDYKTDDDSTWTQAGSFTISPEDTLDVNESNIRQFQYRLRIVTDDQLVPVDITGIVPNGFARSPMRKIFAFEADVRNVTINGKPIRARDVVNWLEEASAGAFPIIMRSKFEQLDDYYNVVIAPPNIYPINAIPETNRITFSAMLL